MSTLKNKVGEFALERSLENSEKYFILAAGEERFGIKFLTGLFFAGGILFRFVVDNRLIEIKIEIDKIQKSELNLNKKKYRVEIIQNNSKENLKFPIQKIKLTEIAKNHSKNLVDKFRELFLRKTII